MRAYRLLISSVLYRGTYYQERGQCACAFRIGIATLHALALTHLNPAMKFRSNNCVSVEVPDLKKAEAFYSGVLGFRLLAKTTAQLEYDTGRFLLYINKGSKVRSPIPSFTVISTSAAKTHLKEHGCEIVEDHGKSLYFRDPFGLIYDVIED